MAHAADPLNQGRLRLEEVERVMTVAWDRHDEGVLWDCYKVVFVRLWFMDVSGGVLTRM